MNTFRNWWFYGLVIVLGVGIVWALIGAIVTESTKPTIESAPYQVSYNNKYILFKDYAISDNGTRIQINGYYKLAIPKYGWDYVETPITLKGDKMLGFGATRRQ